jgi:spore germination protein (amino acid permease)
MIYLLVKRFPDMNIVEIYEAVLGKIIGKVVVILWPCYLIYYAAICSREFFEVIKTYILPNTKDSIIYISFIGVMALMAYKGIESIVRLSYISFIPIMAGLFLIVIMAYPYYDPDLLKPYWGYGLGKTLTIGFLRSSVYQEVLILVIIVKSIQGKGNFVKAGLISLVLSGMIFSICTLTYIMMFTYSMGGENLSGMYQMARAIYYSRYLQRVETIFLFPWVISSLITAAVAQYLALYLYSSVFKINNYKPLTLPFSFLIYVLAMLPKNVVEFTAIYLLLIREYSLGFVYGIPILVLLVALITGRRGEKPSAEEN